MNDCKLCEFIEDRISWELAPYDDVNVRGLAEDIAHDLKSHGYCSEPYFEYEKALMCPVNKRREKECLIVSCPNNTFCRLLRREGYIK